MYVVILNTSQNVHSDEDNVGRMVDPNHLIECMEQACHQNRIFRFLILANLHFKMKKLCMHVFPRPYSFNALFVHATTHTYKALPNS